MVINDFQDRLLVSSTSHSLMKLAISDNLVTVVVRRKTSVLPEMLYFFRRFSRGLQSVIKWISVSSASSHRGHIVSLYLPLMFVLRGSILVRNLKMIDESSLGRCR